MTNDEKRSSPRRQDETLDRMRGCLLGLAAGDAVGTTVEFRPRGSGGLVPEV